MFEVDTNSAQTTPTHSASVLGLVMYKHLHLYGGCLNGLVVNLSSCKHFTHMFVRISIPFPLLSLHNQNCVLAHAYLTYLIPEDLDLAVSPVHWLSRLSLCVFIGIRHQV